MTAEPLLSIRDLSIVFRQSGRETLAVDGVSFDVGKAETVALVGESGSGKSVTALSILKLLPHPAAQPSGEIMFKQHDLMKLSEREMRRVRGDDITIIFQEPMTSLNPLHTIEKQIGEILLLHQGLSGESARARSVEVLSQVGIPDPQSRLKSFPHQLSGGQRQRVMIAMALANEPDLLIADEPTTALDVTVQAQILALLERLRKELGMAIIMITHDLGVVAEMADRIAVMYAGRIVESADTRRLFAAPQHPYTWGLLRSIPSLDGPRGTELVPIPGRPPSLIRRPSGCHFHPRCAYALPSHATIDPSLSEVPGAPGHAAACLLEPAQRDAAWAALRAGGTSEQAREAAGIAEDTLVPSEAAG
jgi:peptide/nickel transport system ATP-binding protein